MYTRYCLLPLLGIGAATAAVKVHQHTSVTQEHVVTPKSAPRHLTIDLDRAVAVALPNPLADLRPAVFHTSDGRSGWVVRIPGSLPIATPAIAKGLLYVGGGYGSHEFYAFDAQTGEVAWKVKTSDDGPTAAVVEDGCCAFNTESCTVIVVDSRTGRVLWQEWLGDPLMSQPTIYRGRLYIAHPAGQRGASRSGAPFELLCADLHTGQHYWQLGIPADVISAPIVEEGKLYFTCMDGTSFCVDAMSGTVIWRRQNGGTSAPLILRGNVVITEREGRAGREVEGIRRLSLATGAPVDRTLVASGGAAYLRMGGGGGVALSQTAAKTLDSSVGFAAAPPAAGLGGANAHLGVSSVVGGWAYQGSRAAYSGGQIMNAQGANLNALRAVDGRVNWRATVTGRDVAHGAQVFSPPALGRANLYLCSAQGHVLSVGQKDGQVRFLYALNQPMTFQPALSGGNLYAGTANGLLVCLRTGDRDADGWTAWGGNAQHNRK